MGQLDTITKPADRAVVATICGEAGMGKTSLAATFPKPIFIRVEDGLQAIPADSRPDAFPVLTGPDMLWDQLIALAKEEHDYQTLVIDSVTKLDPMFTEEILKASNAKSLNQANGGYGGGYQALAAMHGRVRKAAAMLNEKRGMNVIFIAHADVETLKLPDADDYQRWSVRLPARSQPPYTDDVDLIGFIRLVTFIKGKDDERKKAVSTGKREIICHASASNISKNRFGITESLPVELGVNPFAGLLPGIEN